jgi:hypothetical protein
MVALAICATVVVVALACGSDGGTTDSGTPCGPKPAMPWWQPKYVDIECVNYCNDDQSSSYECVNGAWVCPSGIPITQCPCGGGLGNDPDAACFSCSGVRNAWKVCDVDAHVMVCPPGGYEIDAAGVCSDGGRD